MAALIQRVAQQALQTFTKKSSTAAFREDLQHLRNIVHHVTAADINFDSSLVADKGLYREERTETGERVAPVTYLGLFEDNLMTMGVFVLKPGVRLPLHDHPGMHGVIKVIHGTAAIQSYTVAKDRTVPELINQHQDMEYPLSRGRPISVDKLPLELVTPGCAPCLLGPEEGNYHEIHAHEGPMAFLDILAPPYDTGIGNRECNYYKATSLKLLPEAQPNFDRPTTTKANQDDYYLVRTPQPRDFWCDTAMYRGPEIEPDINQT